LRYTTDTLRQKPHTHANSGLEYAPETTTRAVDFTIPLLDKTPNLDII